MKQPPRRLNTWAAFIRWLHSVGILVPRHTRSNMASRVAGTIRKDGSGVYFLRDDLREWVLLLTGYEYAEWMKRYEAAGGKKFVWSAPHAPYDDPRRRTLFTALDERGHTLRLVDGTVFLTHERDVASRWPDHVRDAAARIVEWTAHMRCEGPLWDVEDDAANPKTLVYAKVMREGESSHIVVRGDAFGLEARARTALVAPLAWPLWSRWRPAVDQAYPDATWHIWQSPALLDRYTLKGAMGIEEAPPRPTDAFRV